jgi:dTDP-4-amino-4,6-dideoxygalactose transaminase
VITISAPLIGELEEKLVLDVLRSNRLVQGPMVERFEELVREVAGTRQAIAMNNGTSALIAALMAHHVGPGDEVITSPLTFVATLNAILLVGATPRFVDVGDDFNLNPFLLAEAITPATRAIVPVHLYGYPADMDQIDEVIKDRGIAIVEDAAQAIGAGQGGRATGSFGTGCFSFYATKNITTAEGGAVVTNDDTVATELRILRNQGQRSRYEYQRPGYNFRMTELQAAIGVGQMARLPQIVSARRSNARFLAKALSGAPGVILPRETSDRRHVFHQFTIRLTPDAAVSRETFLQHMNVRGIECGIYYPRPVFDYACFRNDPRIADPEAPTAYRVCGEVVSLPVHPRLTEADLTKISEAALEVLT